MRKVDAIKSHVKYQAAFSFMQICDVKYDGEGTEQNVRQLICEEFLV